MKISIIVPVYNVEQYIRECFESIVAQTYGGALECIFVDDCGQDRSVAVLEELVAAYTGAVSFSIVHHEHNGGLSAARNTGIRHATGDYLYFLDSDDAITPDCIQKLAALAGKYPGVDVVQGNQRTATEWFDLKSKGLPPYTCSRKYLRMSYLLYGKIPMMAWNKLLRAGLVRTHKIYFLEGIIHEDDVWTELLTRYVRSMAFCLDVTYLYRDNPVGIMGRISNVAASYAPVYENLSKNISRPYACYAILKLKNGMVYPDGELPLDEYLHNIPYPLWLLRLLCRCHDIKHDPAVEKWTPRGLASRIGLRLLVPFINATFPTQSMVRLLARLHK